MTVREKMFFLGVNTGFSERGTPTDEALDFYRRRSGNGLYCAIVGNVIPPGGVGTNDTCMEMSSSTRWSALASAIGSQGAIPGIQFGSAWSGYVGNKAFVPPKQSNPIDDYKAAGARISLDEVKTTFGWLDTASDLALSAGFRHLQLHAAHGYLYSLVIDPAFCRFSAEAQAMVVAWVERMRSQGIETSVRVSLKTGSADTDGEPRMVFLREFVSTVRADFIDISDGFYNINKHLIYPSHDDVLRLRHAESIRLATDCPGQKFIISGKASLALSRLAENVSVGICRDLIANDQFLKDFSGGCDNRMKCHFFSRGQPKLRCGQWPREANSDLD